MDVGDEEGEATLLHIPERIVAHTALHQKHPILDKHEFSVKERGKTVEVRPSIIHFRGFTPEVVHQIRIDIVNIGKTAQRFNVLPPTTKFFRIKYEKKGVVPPGMSQEVFIEFLPREERYHYDFIRIHAAQDAIMVPIHGYPALQDIPFPKMIDFGICPVAQTAVRRIVLRNDVPIEFEYRLDVLESNPDFEVVPLEGVVAAESTTEVNVYYTPSRLRTSTMKMVVHLSQFGFKPYVCTVLGSSGAGVAKDKELRKIRKLEAKQEEEISRTMKEKRMEDVRMREEKRAMTQKIRQRDGSKRGSKKRIVVDDVDVFDGDRAVTPSTVLTGKPSPSTAGVNESQTSVIVDGVYFPSNLYSHGSVSFVLTQQPGKIGVRQLRKQPKTKTKGDTMTKTTGSKSGDKAATVGGDKSGEGWESVVSLSHGVDQSQQMKEIDFQRRVSENEEFEKRKEIKWFVCVGEQIPSKEEVQREVETRSMEEQHRIEVEARHDLERKENYQGSELERAVVDYDSLNALGHWSPSFDLNRQDRMHMRSKTLSEFVAAARSVLLRARVKRRIGKIHEHFAREESGMSELSRILPKQTVPFRGSATCLVSLPVYNEEDFRVQKELPLPPPKPFDDWEALPPRVGMAFRVARYRDQPSLLPISMHPVLEDEREFFTGAMEEFGIRSARSHAVKEEVEQEIDRYDVELAADDKHRCKKDLDMNPLQILHPNPNGTTFVDRLSYTEMDAEYLLRPLIHQFHSHALGESSGHHSVFSVGDAYDSFGALLKMSLTRDAKADHLSSRRLAEYSDPEFLKVLNGGKVYVDDRMVHVDEEERQARKRWEEEDRSLGEEDEKVNIHMPRPAMEEIAREFEGIFETHENAEEYHPKTPGKTQRRIVMDDVEEKVCSIRAQTRTFFTHGFQEINASIRDTRHKMVI